MNHLSLFTGIGGLDIAAEWAGFHTVGQVEIDDYCNKVLEKHWPDVPRWRDIKDVTATSIRDRGIGEIAIISGGFPCQPHSLAGKRQASGDERDLWGELARIIGEVKPRWFVGENVRGLLTSEDGRFFGRVLHDLANLGYVVGWAMYGAEHAGALHQRERVFIVANSPGNGLQKSGQHVWLMFKDNKGNPGDWNGRRVDKPGIERMVDGVPSQMDRLKCLGNAVVPQQAYPIFKAIREVE